MDFKSNPGSWDDDLLNAVNITKDPLIIDGIRTSITKKHTVETVHEVVISVKGGREGEREREAGRYKRRKM